MGGELWFGLTILVSAFLLFQVEPIIARTILPWYGGSAAIWTTCLLFFQSVLLLGYLYSHWLYSRLRPRYQSLTHIVLLLASLAVLPILPAQRWKPAGAGDPTFRILLLLAVTVGLPYFLLSTTGPLLQAWHARAKPAGDTYRLYALSNAGSMFALISYPFLFEPMLGTRSQAFTWSWAYAGFVLLCAIVAFRVRRAPVPQPTESAVAARPSRVTYFFWVALPACASILLLSVTNHLSQNVAAIPFLWILPLSLYLLSFILCFEHARWYHRPLFLRLFAVAVAAMAYSLSPDLANVAIKVMIPFFAAGFFVCCMVCHGELVRLKPHPHLLTSYYVMIALGGAVGGIFVALIAPRAFPGYYELAVGLAASVFVVLAVLRSDSASGLAGPWQQPAAAAAALFVLGIAGYLGFVIFQNGKDARVMVRNFYGGLKVIDTTADDSDEPVRRLKNGTITHGDQFLSPEFQDLPTTYYGPDSGIGQAIRQAQPSGPLRVGVIGLGTGTLATYGRPGDYFQFYDINPLVEWLANTQFTFLRRSKARTNVVLGDARLSLEAEPPQNFDVLAVDAFSSDAIPIHLLTREAFALYFRHLKANGVLAVHVSNRHLDLRPIVQTAADYLDKQTRIVESEKNPDQDDIFRSSWMLVASSAISLPGLPVQSTRQVRMWTDDYSNLFQILK